MPRKFPANDYDLVAFFDCLHDMGDPVGAGKHVKETLAKMVPRVLHSLRTDVSSWHFPDTVRRLT
jgi:hypothetical protein